jgi:uncharacterized membrane protein HdeD (DUF308 family)
MREQLAKSIYLVIGVVSLVLGGLYLLSPTFILNVKRRLPLEPKA